MEQEYDKKLLQEIAHKLREGNASDQEQTYFNKWYTQHKDELLELPEDYASNPIVIRDRMHDNLLAQVNAEIQVKTLRITGIWWKSIAAAVILIAVGAGIMFYQNNQKPNSNIESKYANDIAPGKIGATLTLANGKKIRLADAANGEIAKEAGISVTKTADGQIVYQMSENTGETNKINTLSTAKGETYMLTLPDNSKVWLNAASSLTYTASLNERGKRVVRLSGEGYFEITKDKAHPFVVQTAKQEVEVLGTHFNINSYADEAITTTTLLEGSVKVVSLSQGSSQTKILTPGQQALNTGNSIVVAEADMETVMDWKSGDFFLNRINFRTAMRKIARWYDMEVIYDQSVPNNMESSGYISRTNQLSAVLRSIEKSGQVHFRVEGKRIYVSK